MLTGKKTLKSSLLTDFCPRSSIKLLQNLSKSSTGLKGLKRLIIYLWLFLQAET